MNKMRFLFALFILAFIAVIIKLFYLQIIAPESFATDYISTSKINPERGKIFDRNLDPLAINQTTYLLYVEPPKIKDKNYLIRRIDEILKIGEATIESRINDSKQWVAIHGGINEETKNELLKTKLPEIGFQPESRRFYPEASLAAHLIGFVGKNDKGEDLGYFGIEGFYDKDLAGLPGVLKSERDLIGRPIFVGTQDLVDAEDGRSLVLTIDKTVQHIIKNNLKKGMEQFKPKEGCAIAVNPMTMEILGLSCLPDFDPDTYYEYENDVFKNWATSKLYEPGSTFKPLVMAAALEEKKVKPNDFFNEESAVHVSGYRIQNWNDKYEGKITMTRILEKSSNVGMVYVESKLGNKKMYEYLQKYGIGEYTGIDLQGETTGVLKDPKDWYPIDYATSAFGQGIAMTPIQLVRAFSALVNGGYLLEPYVVKGVLENNEIRERERKVVRRVISERTSDIIKKMLVSVVGHAEAKWDMPKGYSIGGKTGTAQIAVQGNYDASKTIASFIGFAPASKPKFLVFIVLREPKSSEWGSETAAPLFFDIANELLIYYNIQPDIAISN